MATMASPSSTSQASSREPVTGRVPVLVPSTWLVGEVVVAPAAVVLVEPLTVVDVDVVVLVAGVALADAADPTVPAS